MVPLQNVSNLWRTLEIPWINCEVNLILTWSKNCVINYIDVANQFPNFTITETNLYVPVVTLSTQDNAKLLPQLKSGFKRTIICNKCLSKPSLLAQNENLNHLVEPSFSIWRWYPKDYLPSLEKKITMLWWMEKIFFDQPVKNIKVTYEILEKLLLVKEMTIQLVLF